MTKPLTFMAILASAIALLAPSTAAAGNALPLDEARGQIRAATETWADLLDGRAKVRDCERTSARSVRCMVEIQSPAVRCEMRISVVRSARFDTVRARGLRCR